MNVLNRINRLWSLVNRSMRWETVFILVTMIVSNGLEVLGIGLILPVLQLATDPVASFENSTYLSATYQALNFTSHLTFTIALFALVFLVFVIKNLVGLWITNIQYKFTWKMIGHFSRQLFRQYLQASYADHIQRNSAELVRNTNFSVATMFSCLMKPTMQLISEGMLAASVMGFLIWLNPIVALVTILAVSLVSLIFLKIVRVRLKIWAEKNETSRGEMIQWPNQAFAGFKQIKALGREIYFENAFSKSVQTNAKAQRLYAFVNHIPRAMMEVLAIGGILLTLAVILSTGESLTPHIPIIGAYCLALIRVLPIATRIITQLNLMKHGVTAMNLVYPDLARLPDESYTGVSHMKVPRRLAHELRLENLSFGYAKSEQPVLSNISLIIPQGTSTAFVGTSGAGKSTLADILLGLLRPTDGRVIVDGDDISQDIRGWRADCGYIAQEVFLLDDTLRRNIALGVEDAQIDEVAVLRAAGLAQITEVIADLPDGIDTVLGEHGVRLSGGQRQRVSIARALYHDPSVLVLDEATSALDSETEHEITAAVDQLSGDKTLIIIAHRLSTVRHCDNIVLLDKGRIADSGSFDELTARSDVFRRMVAHGDLRANVHEAPTACP